MLSDDELKKKPLPSLGGIIRYHTVKNTDKKDSDEAGLTD